MLKSSALVVLIFISAVCFPASTIAQRPNIVLIYAEDISTELSCYGHPAVSTPNIDGLAKTGVLYENAFCTAPSCTPSRNAMLTGLYQTRTDTQDQRRRGVNLPDNVTPFPARLKEQGYHTALGCGYTRKTDHNFMADPGFMSNDWKDRKADQPFFAQITLNVTHRDPQRRWNDVRESAEEPIEPDLVQLPPYFPDDPTCRLDWAMYLDAIEKMDRQVGDILKRLKDEGLQENTVVIFMGDNGRCHLRGKCWLYDAGIQVPLVVRYLPGQATSGETDSRLVSSLDVTATILDLAQVDNAQPLDGYPLIGPKAKEREHVFAARDLIDHVQDAIRCVRTQRYKYIRNYRPELGYQECDYVVANRPMLAQIQNLDAAGKLNPVQQLILLKEKPAEELYDLENDPHEVNNLAEAPEHRAELQRLRERLDHWIADTQDRGLARLQKQ